MNSPPLSIKQLIPGHTYRIKPTRLLDISDGYVDGMGVYQGYSLNFNCKSPTGKGFSPDIIYFDVYKNDKLIDPNTVKVGDNVILLNKNRVNNVGRVTVTRISYMYIFSKHTPPLPDSLYPVSINSRYVHLHEPAQTLMELRMLKELDKIELIPTPDGHNPRVLIDDVLHYMKRFITHTK